MNEKTKPCSSCPSECERTRHLDGQQRTKQENFTFPDLRCTTGRQFASRRTSSKIAGFATMQNQLAHVANGTGGQEAAYAEMLRISKETWRLVKRNGRWHIPAFSRPPGHRSTNMKTSAKDNQECRSWKKPLISIKPEKTEQTILKMASVPVRMLCGHGKDKRAFP